MAAASSRVITRAAYTAQYSDPINLRAGDVVEVHQADADFPEWFWCQGPCAKEGWVHFSFLSQTTGKVTALRDYSARELTLQAGERGWVIELLGGWAYLTLDDGRVGWVSADVLDAAV
jgi:hypothetical protein